MPRSSRARCPVPCAAWFCLGAQCGPHGGRCPWRMPLGSATADVEHHESAMVLVHMG